MNIFLFIGGSFLAVSALGRLLEKIRVPWIFAALFLGLILSALPISTIHEIDNSQTFHFLAELGMYFLLFLIGYDLDLKRLRKLGKFIATATTIIILSEAALGSLLVHFLFGYSWLISIIVSLSFATIGEAMLVPILDEFKLTKTKLGQTILGIGTFDDILEILLIVAITILLPIFQQDHNTAMEALSAPITKPLIGVVALLVVLSVLFTFDKKIRKLRTNNLETSFFFLIATFFIFLGIANYISPEMNAIAAILAGVAANNYLPTERQAEIEKEVKAISYGFLAPIFFLWVGLETDVYYLLSAPLLVLAVIIVTYSAKIISSYIVGYKTFGPRKSLIMGIALGVRFSTSIVIIKFLYENSFIDSKLYSVLIGSTIAFKFIVPFILAHLIKKWKISTA